MNTKPNPRTRQINIRLSEEEYSNLSRSAAIRGIGRAAYVRMLLKKLWNEQSAENEHLFSRPGL